jgi:5'-3' exonuclease
MTTLRSRVKGGAPRVLIFDGNFNFTRYFMASLVLDSRDMPIGAAVGFLRSLGATMHTFSPSEVIVVWDGAGGSLRRRAIYKDYKGGRKPPTPMFQKNYALTDDEVKINRAYQMDRLVRYLDYTPVKQAIIDDCEADDIIAFLTRHHREQGHHVIIVSSDKDFWQLVCEGVIVFRPVQDQIITWEEVESMGCAPENFALFRAIDGDPSDNVKGIHGLSIGKIGKPGKIAKYFPFFKRQEPKVTLDELLSYCQEHAADKRTKLYQTCVENFEIIRRNYELFQLHSPLVSPYQVEKLMNELDSYDTSFDGAGLMQAATEDGFGQGNLVYTAWDEFRQLSIFHNGSSRVV